MPPEIVSYNLDRISHVTVKPRLRELADRGLPENVEDTRGYYQITDRGRAYLAGEIDAEELEKSD